MLRPGGSFKRIEANPSAGTDQTSTATATPPLLTRIMPGWRSLIDQKRYAGSVAASRTKVALTASCGKVAHRDNRAFADSDLLAVHESKERQRRACQGESSGLHEHAFDDENRDRSQNETAEDRTSAKDPQAIVQNALVSHLENEVTHLLRIQRGDHCARSGQCIVDLRHAPVGQVRN